MASFRTKYMLVNIISLPHRTDRLRTAIAQCEQGGMDYKVWKGIKIEGNPAKGISQAHKQIVRWAKKRDLPEVFIVEDDFMLTNPRSFEYFLENKPEEYDIYLGGVSGGEMKDGFIITQFSGLFFYMVKSCFYDAFLEADESMHIDMYVGLPQQSITQKLGRRQIIKCCNPMVAVTTDGVSDNSGQLFVGSIFFRRYPKFRGYNSM